MASTGNKIYHNNFAANEVNATCYPGSNQWDDGYLSGGNYWGDYTGEDLDGDGIGDMPYIIPDGGIDFYPLMDPFNPPSNIVVNKDTGDTFVSIQSAIDDPLTLNGHTLVVSSGTYYENITLHKGVCLKGEDREKTFIDGKKQGDAVHIIADSAYLCGFTVKNGENDYAGVHIASNHAVVANNQINAYYSRGIFVDGGSGVTLSGNSLPNIRDEAIHLIAAQDCLVTGNLIISTSESSGIVLCDGSQGNLICGNNVSNVEVTGIELRNHASGNTVFSNSVLNSGDVGIAVNDNCDDNRIYHNNVYFSEGSNATMNAGCFNNSWDNGYPSGGNYWSDYTGDDRKSGENQNLPGSDGIGDEAYQIPGWGNGKDHYPLMEPFQVLTADAHHLDAGTGGIIKFNLDAGNRNGNRNYLILGSITGAFPGTPLPGGQATLYLNWDIFTGIVVAYLNTALFDDFLGNLNASGFVSARFDTLGPIPDAMGHVLTFACALNSPWDYASDPVYVVVLP